MSCSFSVVIPLYNKCNEIERTLRSVLSQSLCPLEIIVVDDGSSDGSADVVHSINSPLVQLIQQANSGVCVARNKGIAQSKGDYIAFLDADDWWDEHYLKSVADLINKYPDCGLYFMGYIAHRGGETYPQRVNIVEGVMTDYFVDAFYNHICLPSCAILARSVFSKVGDFPEGMRLGEDQYMWTKVASEFKVCFSPLPLMHYNIAASNRSNVSYKPEFTKYSFKDFYDEGKPSRNEFIARCEIGRAIVISAKGGDAYAKDVEQFFGYTQLYSRGLKRLKLVNRLPKGLRQPFLEFYNLLARILIGKVN